MTRTFTSILKTNDTVAEDMGPSTAVVSICDTNSSFSPVLSILVPVCLPLLLPSFDPSSINITL